ncbi:MAG: transaldolase family protein [Patescibacteria group bacterium]
MKPENLKTKIFLDSGDPAETKLVLEKLGWLDGQTTNPSLVAKNPEAQKRLASGNKFTKQEINDFYKSVITEISAMIPDGSVSIEVYADKDTKAEDMINEGRQMNSWISDAHIKLPITFEGLKAAETLTGEGIRVNMTLCFSQEQGAAVYTATRSAKKGDVFLSPFIGRLDDIGQNGMSFIENMHNMFQKSDGHVELLAASVRTYEHFKQCLFLGVDLITAPAKILLEWAENNYAMPEQGYVYNKAEMKDLDYQEIDLNKDFRDYNIQHDLTDQGIEKFVADWNNLLQ